MREAEPLMWENRFDDAIPIYEAGLDAGWDESPTANLTRRAEVEQYAAVRLALAYALTERMDESTLILNALMAEPSTSEAIQAMVEAVAAADSALDRCVATYNLWRDYELSTFHYPSNLITLEVGRMDHISHMVEDSPPEPEKAGCDAPALINILLDELVFPTNQSPVATLSDAGVDVLDTLVADLNADGDEEWIVWLDAWVSPVLFVPQGDRYVLSRPEIRRPNEYTYFDVRSVPQQDDPIFVDYAFFDQMATNLNFYRYDIHQDYCEEDTIRDDGANPGEVRIWRLVGTELSQILARPVCRTLALTDLFNDDSSRLYAADVSIAFEDERNNHYDHTNFAWDATSQTYTPIRTLVVTPTPRPTDPSQISWPTITDSNVLDVLSEVSSLLYADNPAQALIRIDETLAQPDLAVEMQVHLAAHYYRALVLQALDRTDEALAEYLAIIDAEPDSAWGMLAALHVER